MCKHENADHLRAGEGWALMDGTAMPDALCEQFRCLDCGAWLSLGPSNDEPEAVRIEMRAAEMLACHEQDDRCRCFRPSRRLAPLRLERQARDLVSDAMWTALVSARHEEGKS